MAEISGAESRNSDEEDGNRTLFLWISENERGVVQLI
jgi:hypothetical protein